MVSVKPFVNVTVRDFVTVTEKFELAVEGVSLQFWNVFLSCPRAPSARTVSGPPIKMPLGSMPLSDLARFV